MKIYGKGSAASFINSLFIAYSLCGRTTTIDSVGNRVRGGSMKTISRSIYFFFTCLFLLFGAVSAYAADQKEKKQPYNVETAEIISNLKSCSFDAAFAAADGFVNKTVNADNFKQDKHIALLERGKIALASDKLDQAITDLQEAEKKFLMIEGTISLTEGFGSILTDDTVQEYEAEMHEKLMISPYLTMAYLLKNDLDGAVVERNRTINKINQYIESNLEERSYLENPFARLMSAIVYEMEGRNDDAAIEYKKMKSDNETSRMENRKDKSSDLVLIFDMGLSPQKYEEKWGPTTISAAGKSITLGFAYAAYKPTNSGLSDVSISIDGKPAGAPKILYDLEKTILAQYDKNKSSLVAKIVARMTAKAVAQVGIQAATDKIADNIPFGGFLFKKAAQAAGAKWIADEQADLRGWRTLPKNIQYLRINGLEAGEHIIKINYGSESQTKKVQINNNSINTTYFVVAN